MKKLFYSLGSALTIATPIITVVSCGKQVGSSKTHSLSSKNDDSLSQGIEIKGDEIEIDFAQANFDSSKFAQDVLNFFNSHKGRKVGITFKNSENQKLNNHEIQIRVSINGYSSFGELLNDISKKLDESFISFDIDKIMANGYSSSEVNFRSIPFEKAKADYEKWQSLFSNAKSDLERKQKETDRLYALLLAAKTKRDNALQAYNQEVAKLNALLPSDQQVQIAHSIVIPTLQPQVAPEAGSQIQVPVPVPVVAGGCYVMSPGTEAERIARQAAERAAAEAARQVAIASIQTRLNAEKIAYDQAQAALSLAQSNYNNAKAQSDAAKIIFDTDQTKLSETKIEFEKF